MKKTADMKQYMKEYVKKNKERIKARRKVDNKPKVQKKDKKQYQRDYYIKHKDKILARAKKIDKGKRNEYHKKYYAENLKKPRADDGLTMQERRQRNALRYYYEHRDRILQQGKDRRNKAPKDRHFEEIEGFTINFETI
jgi:hypothetical protein